MSNADKRTLIRLGGATTFQFDPAHDFRGRRVIDVNGEDVGDVRDLYVDGVEKKTRLVVLAVGGFIGLGRMRFALPAETVVRVSDHAIHINRERTRVMSSPAYEPDLIDHHFVRSVYQHYGLIPSWTDGQDDGAGFRFT